MNTNLSSVSGSFPNHPLPQQSSLQKIEGQNCTLTAYNSPRLTKEQMQSIANDLFKEFANNQNVEIQLTSDHPRYKEILENTQVEPEKGYKIAFALKKLNVMSDQVQIITPSTKQHKGKPSRATVKIKSAEVDTSEVKTKLQESFKESKEVTRKPTIPSPPTPPRPNALLKPDLPLRPRHLYEEEVVKTHPDQFQPEKQVIEKPVAHPTPVASNVTSPPISQPSASSAHESPRPPGPITKLATREILKPSTMPPILWNAKKIIAKASNQKPASAPESPHPHKMPPPLPSSNSAPASPRPPPLTNLESPPPPLQISPPPLPKNPPKPLHIGKVSPPPIPSQFMKERDTKSGTSDKSPTPSFSSESKPKTPPPLPPGYGNAKNK